MEDHVEPASLAQPRSAVRTGTSSAQEQLGRACARIAEADGHVQAFVAEPGREDRLQEAAHRLSEHASPGGAAALHGLPVGVKDVIRVAGLPTQAGSALPPEALDGEQATVIERLTAAGALIAGKTVTAEFAVAAPGPTRNPHRLDHTPGGSSSGSAAAVAAGMVPLALGTQTIASVIRPAAYCGVVGFKPTHGRIPVDGVIPTAPSYDTVGLFAADVDSAELAAAQLCDDWRPRTPGDRDHAPVLGVPVGPYLDCVEPTARAAFDDQVAQLRGAGYRVVEVPAFDDFENDAFWLIVVNLCELARSHGDWFARYGELYDSRTAEAIQQGQGASEDDYAQALTYLEAFRDRLSDTAAAHGVDAWLTPSATGPAPHGLDQTGDSVMSLPWSAAGLPCLSLPAPHPSVAMPLGIQLVGHRGADEQLLAWAHPLGQVVAGGGSAGRPERPEESGT